MTKKAWKGVWALLVVLVLLGVVASAQQYPVTVIDDRGVEVTIDSQPNRIVVAGIPLYTEILIDLGALDRLIAVAGSPDNPPEVADFPTVGPSFSPNVEVIISLDPDLVLGPGDWGGERGKLESAGITVLTTRPRRLGGRAGQT
jgi:ABC-type Fe3+-hydroxamate transport system substrate-binding protein